MDSNDDIKNGLWEKLQELRENKTSELRGRHYLGRVPEPPKLVLSVIGDSSSFVPEPWFTSVLKAGLIETAKGAKDCLIIYKGSSEKVSTIVREAVVNFEKLSTEGDDDFICLVGLLPKIDVNIKDEHYHLDRQDTHQYGREHWKMSNRVLGEIFNIQMKEDLYPKAHASTLKAISKNKTSFMKLQDNFLTCLVPVLTIVAEGDFDTIESVLQVLKQNLPVLILKGSGKAADFIADFIWDGNSESSDEYVKDKTPLTFGVISYAPQLNGLSEKLKEIKEHKCLVTLIDITTQTKPTEFSDFVTKAIIRGWSQRKPEVNRSEMKASDYNNESNDPTKEKHETTPDPRELYSGTNSEKCPSVIQPNSNKVHPMTVTMNAVCEVNYDFHTKKGAFMETYKETLTPASLPLYYYIAYQFIQEMNDPNNGTENTKVQNFNILLKEAIVANRDEYVSVLLEEDGVRFEENHFPDIYEETVLSRNREDTDFQHILKWGSSSSIDSLRSSCHIKRIGDLLANTQKWLQRHPLKEAKDASEVLFNKFKDTYDKESKGKQIDQSESLEEQSKLMKSTKCAATCVSKVIGTLTELDYAKEALEWLKNFDNTDFTNSLTVKFDFIPELLNNLRKYATSLKRAIHLFKELADEQQTTWKTIKAKQDSYRKISNLLKEGAEMFSTAEEVVGQLRKLDAESNPKYRNLFKKSIEEISSYSSHKCIKACRNICQALLGYPKSECLDNRLSVVKENNIHEEKLQTNAGCRHQTGGSEIQQERNEAGSRDQAGCSGIQQESSGGGAHEEMSCRVDQSEGVDEPKKGIKDDNLTKSDSSFEDLLIWAILVNRPKLATIFWMKCNNQLCKY
ncbi:uncharacterized protein LOC127734332 [Mytilus californianus]|uniref:uncharacterized protein LOC127734332 n=1 Tax=Mytilus californianus TaxID=6549 RepID=UPI002245241C|nr:uncharacterized protein LOC127734332 [Mytilus californianus]